MEKKLLEKLEMFQKDLKYHGITVDQFLLLYELKDKYSLICHRNRGFIGTFYNMLKERLILEDKKVGTL